MIETSVPWWEFVVRGLVVYTFLLVLLRLTGKRPIGQMSPFDLVLLLILSNAVQNSMNAGDNSITGGIISATTLVVANHVVGVVTFKSRRLERLIEGGPQVLVHDGRLYADVLRSASITRRELDTTLREAGFFDLKDVRLALLENNGKVSVLGYEDKPGISQS